MQIKAYLFSLGLFLTAQSLFAGSLAKVSIPEPKAEVAIKHGNEGNKPIPLNEMVTLKVKITAKEPLDLTFFDASMPEHMHGMVTKPRIKKVKTNEYEISGVKLHMPGKWLFAARLADKKGKLYKLTSDYQL